MKIKKGDQEKPEKKSHQASRNFLSR